MLAGLSVCSGADHITLEEIYPSTGSKTFRLVTNATNRVFTNSYTFKKSWPANNVATNQAPKFVFQAPKIDPKYFQGYFVNIRPVNRKPTQADFYTAMDFTATNLEFQSSHKPIIIGQSNGMWIVRFEEKKK